MADPQPAPRSGSLHPLARRPPQGRSPCSYAAQKLVDGRVVVLFFIMFLFRSVPGAVLVVLAVGRRGRAVWNASSWAAETGQAALPLNRPLAPPGRLHACGRRAGLPLAVVVQAELAGRPRAARRDGAVRRVCRRSARQRSVRGPRGHPFAVGSPLAAQVLSQDLVHKRNEWSPCLSTLQLAVSIVDLDADSKGVHLLCYQPGRCINHASIMRRAMSQIGARDTVSGHGRGTQNCSALPAEGETDLPEAIGAGRMKPLQQHAERQHVGRRVRTAKPLQAFVDGSEKEERKPIDLPHCRLRSN
jgi:hypothetical protein